MSEADRRAVDDGQVFADLADTPRVVIGPFRSVPYAHDGRLAPRLPSGGTVGSGNRVHAARHRSPAIVQPLSAELATFAAQPGDVFTRPADSSEALEWRELTHHVDVVTPLERQPDGLAIELVRIDVPEWGLAVVERLATFIRAQALDEEGEPVGLPFVSCDCDPFAEPIHPTSGLPLVVRWSLVGQQSTDPQFVGLPSSGVPAMPIQIQPHWTDQRFSYGSRYTVDLQLEFPPGATSARVFVTVPPSLDRWQLRLGARLAVWWLPTGPRAAALHAAIRRT